MSAASAMTSTSSTVLTKSLSSLYLTCTFAILAARHGKASQSRPRKTGLGMEFLGRLDTEAGLVAEGRAQGEPDQAEAVGGAGASCGEPRTAPETAGGVDGWPGALRV